MSKRTNRLKREAFLRRPGTGIVMDYRKWRNRNHGSWFVTVFDTRQEYGGPEEGGWWYRSGDRAYGYRVRGYQAAVLLAEELEATIGKEQRVRLSREPEHHFPKQRPHYC